MTRLQLFSPSGRIEQPARLRRAAKQLRGAGFDVGIDADALAREQRFAGSDENRLAALHRTADAAPSVAMATRGGYGLTRLLEAIDWPLLARAVDRGTRWVGHSDFTALQLGLLAHSSRPSWAGPMALDDFGRGDDEGGVDEVTRDCFVEAMGGELLAVGWRTEAGFDGLDRRGLLWGGNLAMICSLLGTPHLPAAKQFKGGILFLEDVGEHPYRVERMLLQLLQAGVIDSQRALLLGSFSGWKPAPNDHGYRLKTVVAYLREATRVPIVTGLPFGHVQPKLTLPVGLKVRLQVDGREVSIGW
jgi:muramoyltetrapeptide carboxypeptidase